MDLEHVEKDRSLEAKVVVRSSRQKSTGNLEKRGHWWLYDIVGKVDNRNIEDSRVVHISAYFSGVAGLKRKGLNDSQCQKCEK